MRWAVAAVVVGACFSPAFPTGAPCTNSTECPGGQVCTNDRCELPCPTCSDAAIDEVPPTVTCLQRWLAGTPTFATPTRIEELRDPLGGNTFNPTLSDDQLAIRVAQNTGTDLDIRIADRPSTAVPFGGLRPIVELNTPMDEAKVSITANGLVAVFASTRAGGLGGQDLWQASRSSTMLPFGPASNVAFATINDDANQFDPELTPDGLDLYYAPNVNGTQQIHHASRPQVAMAFGMPEVVDVGFATAFDPTISPDQRVIVFATGGMQRDLYYATRIDVDGPFGAPMLIPVNSSANDGDPDLSADGCTLVFTSNRDGPASVYLAAMQP